MIAIKNPGMTDEKKSAVKHLRVRIDSLAKDYRIRYPELLAICFKVKGVVVKDIGELNYLELTKVLERVKQWKETY